MPTGFEIPPDHPQVATAKIERPNRAHALDPESPRELAAHWRRIDDDEAIRRVEQRRSELQEC